MSGIGVDEARRRIDRERRAADDEQIGGGDGAQRAFDHGAVERFAIEHHVRLDDAAAFAARHAFAGLHVCSVIGLLAAHAVVFVDRSMQFKDVFRAGLLMKPVDVLRHDGKEFALPLPLRQFLVRGVGANVGDEHLLPIKAEKLLRVLIEKRIAEDRFRRICVLLPVEAVHAAKVGDAAFRGHARAAEKDDALALFHPGLQRFQSIHIFASGEVLKKFRLCSIIAIYRR